MIRTAAFPARYVQGAGALRQLGTEAERFAETVLVIVDQTLPEDVIARVPVDAAIQMHAVRPECTLAAIAEATELAKSSCVSAIAGMGGGKVIDLGRASADDLGLPFISIPTVAASDAPCSGLSVIYDETGAVERVGGIKYTIKDGIVYDAQELLEDVKRMGEEQKAERERATATDAGM